MTTSLASILPAATAESTATLRERFDRVRSLTLASAAGLSDADASAQSMPDASPSKWHLAHTTWFFETFVLRDFVRNYRPFNSQFSFLYNSYYEAEGRRLGRPSRGLLTRPSLDDVRAYRAHDDAAMRQALECLPKPARESVLLGCRHEEEHQELLLTDVLHLVAQNPLNPAVWAPRGARASVTADPLRWTRGRQGPIEIGRDGSGFGFDCEGPRHTVWLTPHALADRLIPNEEWRSFIADGGYGTANLWLSDGWAWVGANAIEAPLYWRQDEDGEWTRQFGLDGLMPIDCAAPVRHVSYYEADAFARWVGARLPSEAEWESAAQGLDSATGNFVDEAGPVHPAPAAASDRHVSC